MSKNEQYVRLQIKICDNGQGISQEGVKQLFTNFKMLSENEKLNKSGTGLGLSICKQIIQQMGGTIICKSKIGVGTQFIISLPVRINYVETVCESKVLFSSLKLKE